MVCQPHAYLRDLAWEVFVFDSVELFDVYFQHWRDVCYELYAAAFHPQDFEFERPQFAVGDDEEVAASAGRV
ncbi:MAG: hypothetical protein FWB94_10010, partial [Chitinispirillia bacterium]|nr:hypothetical protein [Chitinispirillia bacterium]